MAITNYDISPTLNLVKKQVLRELYLLHFSESSNETTVSPKGQIFFHIKNGFFLEGSWQGFLDREDYEFSTKRNDTLFILRNYRQNYSLSFGKWIKLMERHHFTMSSSIGFDNEESSLSEEYYSSGGFLKIKGFVENPIATFTSKQLTGSLNAGFILSFTKLVHLNLTLKGLVTYSRRDYVATFTTFKGGGVPINTEYSPNTTFQPVLDATIIFGTF